MTPHFPALASGILSLLTSASSLNAQTLPTNTHYVVLTIKMVANSQQAPREFSFFSASSNYGQAPKNRVATTAPGYVLEYVTEGGERICTQFNLGPSPYDGSIASGFSASIPTEHNGTGYRIYKDGVLLWTEDIASPKGNLPISVQDLGKGKLRILPDGVRYIYLSEDGGLNWEIVYRPELTPDWVYQVPKFNPLKLPKPIIRVDVWHKLRRQSFTYEVGRPPTSHP